MKEAITEMKDMREVSATIKALDVLDKLVSGLTAPKPVKAIAFYMALCSNMDDLVLAVCSNSGDSSFAWKAYEKCLDKAETSLKMLTEQASECKAGKDKLAIYKRDVALATLKKEEAIASLMSENKKIIVLA